MKPVFVEVDQEHIPVVLGMMEEFNSMNDYPYKKETNEQNLIEFVAHKSLGHMWLIQNDDEIVGYIILTLGYSFEYMGKDAFIDELFIKENFRNHGVGKKAMEFVESKAKELGIKALHLEVEDTNEVASQLYTNRGYSGNHRSLLTKKL